jgi:hypothetical protein
LKERIFIEILIVTETFRELSSLLTFEWKMKILNFCEEKSENLEVAKNADMCSVHVIE